MRVVALAALVASGCAIDTDGDGLTNREERELGSDPELVDTDGDGIDDGTEVEMGIDPSSADSDGDGYLDLDEMTEGTDPASDASVIYEGGWPYLRDKDALGDPGTDRVLALGDQIGRFVGVDQFGEQFDLYDIMASEVPVMIDVSATWCPPCNTLSAWLSEGNEQLNADWPGVRRAVNNGDVRWVTIMIQNESYEPATRRTVREWDETYPHEMIPVIADPDAVMANHLTASGLPALRLLEPDLTLATAPDAPYWDVLSELSGRL